MSVDMKFQVEKSDVGLLVIDVQERLAAAMSVKEMAFVEKNVIRLLEVMKLLSIPIVVTEQYPRGIGATIPAVQAAFPDGLFKNEKVDFSCCAVPDVMKQIEDSGRKRWILCGMEAHICVLQTARELLERGFQVIIPEDAVISRTERNRMRGLALTEAMGASISSTETLLFDLVKKAGTPEFKVISKLIR